MPTVNAHAMVADKVLAATGLGALVTGLVAEAAPAKMPGWEYISYGVLALVLLGWAKARIDASDAAWQKREELMQAAHKALEEKFYETLVGSVTSHRDAMTANAAAVKEFREFLSEFAKFWERIMETRPCVALDPGKREVIEEITAQLKHIKEGGGQHGK